MEFVKLITVEPVLFLQMVGDTLTYVIYQNLFIDKICRNKLKYGKHACAKYAKFTEETIDNSSSWLIPMKNNIQESAAGFILYDSLVENSLPMIIVLLLGVWSDAKRKRKPLFLFALFGKFFHSLGLLLNAWFMEWSPMLLILTATLPYSIGGAKVVFHMATYSYIADSCIARHRTWRLSIAEAIFNIGAWIGFTLGVYLYRNAGFVCVFATSVGFHFVAIVYTILFVPETSGCNSQEVTARYPELVHTKHQNSVAGADGHHLVTSSNYGSESDLPEACASPQCVSEISPLLPSPREIQTSRPIGAQDLKQSLLALRDRKEKKTSISEYIYGTFRPIFKKRDNHARMCVILMGIIMLLYGVSGNGEASLTYLYTRYKFQWREHQFSNWRIFDSVMVVLGLGIIMPLFTSVFHFSDLLTGALAATARFLAVSCIGFAPHPIYLFAGSVMDTIGVLMPIIARSVASKCVITNERGRVFAFLGCIEAVARLVSVPLYSVIYAYTLTTQPSTIYFVSMGMYFTIMGIFSSLFIGRKLNMLEYEAPVPSGQGAGGVKIVIHSSEPSRRRSL